MSDWKEEDGWIAADSLVGGALSHDVQTGESASLFNDNGVLYLKGDTAEEWFWMENMPSSMENKC